MILSLSNQASVFLVTIIIGICIGLIYDFFRLLRKLFIHKNSTVYIEDSLFWLLSTFLAFYILLHKNNLEFRFYLLLGIALGIILYFSFVSYYVLKFFVYTLTLLAKPISFCLKLIKPHLSKIYVMKNKTIYKKKIILQKVYRYGKIKRKDLKSTIKIILDKI